MPSLRRIAEVLYDEAVPTIFPPTGKDAPTSEEGVKLPITKAERRAIAPGSLRRQTGAQGRSTAARKEREWREANPYPGNPGKPRKRK